MGATALSPLTADEVRDAVAQAAAEGTVLEVRGGGSKADIGNPNRATTVLDVSALDQVVEGGARRRSRTLHPGVRRQNVRGRPRFHGSAPMRR